MPNIYPIVSVIIPYKNDPAGQQTYVMVQEKDSGLWNQPGGGIEFTDKEPIRAASREVLEETGLTVVVDGFIGFYAFPSRRGNRILSTCFSANYIEGNLQTRTDDIIRVEDMTFAQIKKLHTKEHLRSGDANIKPLEDYISRGTIPLERVFHFLE
jgi:8-oxo-dGTP pyrophosphatase MutT (NUDIX family)